MPYIIFSYFALPVPFLVGLMCIIGLKAPITLVVLAVLCCMITPIGLVLDKQTMRYRIDTQGVLSRDLLRKHCRLEDAQVKQIELTLSVGYHGLYRMMSDNDTPFLICSDGFHKHDKNISLSYHRKSQIAVRITRKNFPAVQAYLQRMGIASGAVNYDVLVQILQCAPGVYRRIDGEWKQE